MGWQNQVRMAPVLGLSRCTKIVPLCQKFGSRRHRQPVPGLFSAVVLGRLPLKQFVGPPTASPRRIRFDSLTP